MDFENVPDLPKIPIFLMPMHFTICPRKETKEEEKEKEEKKEKGFDWIKERVKECLEKYATKLTFEYVSSSFMYEVEYFQHGSYSCFQIHFYEHLTKEEEKKKKNYVVECQKLEGDSWFMIKIFEEIRFQLMNEENKVDEKEEETKEKSKENKKEDEDNENESPFREASCSKFYKQFLFRSLERINKDLREIISTKEEEEEKEQKENYEDENEQLLPIHLHPNHDFSHLLLLDVLERCDKLLGVNVDESVISRLGQLLNVNDLVEAFEMMMKKIRKTRTFPCISAVTHKKKLRGCYHLLSIVSKINLPREDIPEAFVRLLAEFSTIHLSRPYENETRNRLLLLFEPHNFSFFLSLL